MKQRQRTLHNRRVRIKQHRASILFIIVLCTLPTENRPSDTESRIKTPIRREREPARCARREVHDQPAHHRA
jgi:hypothetical protein